MPGEQGEIMCTITGTSPQGRSTEWRPFKQEGLQVVEKGGEVHRDGERCLHQIHGQLSGVLHRNGLRPK